MLKKSLILISSSIILFGLSGCKEIEGDYYKVIDLNPTKNIIKIKYNSDKIAEGFFREKVNEYCNQKKLIASLNSIKVINQKYSIAEYSCIIDD